MPATGDNLRDEIPPHPLWEKSTRPDPPVFTSDEILQGARMVEIEHDGETYRLMQTKAGKLILNK